MKINRPDYSGKNNPNYKNGWPKCIDCGEEVKNRYAKRCRKCYLEDHTKHVKNN